MKATGVVFDRVLQHVLLLTAVRMLRLEDSESEPSQFAMFAVTQAMSILNRVLACVLARPSLCIGLKCR